MPFRRSRVVSSDLEENEAVTTTPLGGGSSGRYSVKQRLDTGTGTGSYRVDSGSGIPSGITQDDIWTGRSKESTLVWGRRINTGAMRRACNRYYEHVKRKFKLLVENKIEEDRRAKALNNRRHRLLNARRAVAEKLLSKEDYSFMKDAPACLMSDEETDPDERQTWRVSQPEWRASRLHDILKTCQEKLGEQQSSSSRMVHWRVASGVAS